MIPNPYSAKFFAFEGPDGCGKSTQLKKSLDWIREELKKAVIATKEPNKDGVWGSRIYMELARPNGLHKTDPFGFQTWYACDSKINLHEVVIPHLKAGCIVLSDRFRLSMCYGANCQDDIRALMAMNQRIIGEDFIWPDAIFIFDVSPETAIERLKKKNIKLDEHEKIEILKQVRANYISFSRLYNNCYGINGEFPSETVFAIVKRILSKVLGFNQVNNQGGNNV